MKIKLLFVALLLSSIIIAQNNNNFELSKNLEIYGDIMRKLNLQYADDINPGDLTKTAIDAMLQQLDPYTVYVPESKLEDFELMTKGEYGGIGALIQKQGDYVVITEPYEGFPAQKSGLKPGDRIVEIGGESAIGKTSSQISEKLKGVPGSVLKIKTIPFNDTLVTEHELVREKIKFPNIPYSGMLDKQIGYISLSQFNPNSAADVKNAFLELKKNKDLKGLILDLRNNGGGLLNEAVDIVNTFVPKGETIVITKGKLKKSTMIHKTKSAALDKKIPVVVLVNENTASASEIVSGSLQDLDRAVIIGQKTFGKGLVQNILMLPYNSKLKITVAKYYIPSGRCIQAIDYFEPGNNGDDGKIPDSVLSVFKTRGGREVFDGAGIFPDISIRPELFSQISADLYAGNYIFNFANAFFAGHDSISKAKDFSIDDETYNKFKESVEEQGFDYLTETETILDRMQKSAEREHYLDAISAEIDQLKESIKMEKKKDIDKFRTEIEEMLRIEIISRYYYQKGKIIASLQNDKEVKKAIDVLNDTELYHSILKGTYKETETKE
ncbi:MAG: PDZ domain-containing protein [Chlorobi bacterium]|nr:PDZ domain-containing protein [Chlorobiota bacterium]